MEPMDTMDTMDARQDTGDSAEPKIYRTLGDTIDEMLSHDYRARFVAEYWQTKIRYEKLKKFLNKIEAARIIDDEDREPKHDCPLGLLRDQQHEMGQYLHILEIRAEIERIEL